MCSIEGTLTLSEIAQTATLTACPTFTGSVEVTDAIGAVDLVLDNIEVIDGNFTITNTTELTGVTASSLRNVTGTLGVVHTSTLTTLDFPELEWVNFLNLFSSGPDLVDISLLNLAYIYETVLFNTSIASTESIGLKTTQYLSIVNNDQLNTVSFPALETVGIVHPNATNNGIGVSGNQASALSFPVLTNASTFYISQCASLSVPELKAATINISENPDLAELDFPVFVDGQFWVIGNPVLKNISAPLYVGSATESMQVVNNNELTELTLPMMKEIDGAILYGNFTSIQFPALTAITGDIFIKSNYSAINASCTELQTFAKAGFSCTYPGSDAPNNDKAEKIGGGIGGTVAFFVFVAAAIVGIWYWRMRRKAKRMGGMGGEGYELR